MGIGILAGEQGAPIQPAASLRPRTGSGAFTKVEGQHSIHTRPLPILAASYLDGLPSALSHSGPLPSDTWDPFTKRYLPPTALRGAQSTHAQVHTYTHLVGIENRVITTRKQIDRYAGSSY